jgi:hypothetical protein
LLAAICTALDVELSELFREVTDTLRREEKLAGSVAGSNPRVPATPGPESSDSPQMRALPTVAA